MRTTNSKIMQQPKRSPQQAQILFKKKQNKR